jgi:integrase
MANVKSRLRPGPAKKDNTRTIQVVYSHGAGGQFVLSTDFSVEESEWDSKDGVTISNEAANDQISILTSQIWAAVAKIRMEGMDPIPGEVKKYLNQSKKLGMPVAEALEENIRHLESTKKSPNTIINRKTLLGLIQRYEKNNNLTLFFKDINGLWGSKVISGLIDGSLTTRGTGMSNSAIKAYLAHFCSFMSWAQDQEMHQNDAYKGFAKKLKSLNKAPAETLMLTTEEVDAIWNFDLNGYPQQWKDVRDGFVFMCDTSLRMIDVFGNKDIDFTPASFEDVEHLDRASIINVMSSKTGKVANIVLSDRVKEIISRRTHQEGRIFQPITNNRFNHVLKEIARKAGLDRSFVYHVKSGSRKERVEDPVWRKIAAHCARRYFACEAVKRGIRIEMLQRIMGHVSIEQTAKYFRVTKDQVIEEQLEKMA